MRRVALPYRTLDPIPQQAERRYEAAVAALRELDLSDAAWLATKAAAEDDREGTYFADDVEILSDRLAKLLGSLETIDHWRTTEPSGEYTALKLLGRVVAGIDHIFDEYGPGRAVADYAGRVRESLAEFLRYYFGIDTVRADAIADTAYGHEYTDDVEEVLGGIEGWERIIAMEENLDRIGVALDEIQAYGTMKRSRLDYAAKWTTESMRTRPSKIFPDDLDRYEKMWHVTTALDAVMSEGLKAKDQLDAPTGLGGGSSELISFTASLPHAEAIYDAMLILAALVQGPKTIASMREYADVLGLSEEGWEKALASFRSSYGDVTEPFSPNKFRNLYEAVTMYASEEGLAYAAFFFDYDTGKKFAAQDPDQLGIIEAIVDTSSDATTYHRAEEEWRIPPENVVSLGAIDSQDAMLRKLQPRAASLRVALEQPEMRRVAYIPLDGTGVRTASAKTIEDLLAADYRVEIDQVTLYRTQLMLRETRGKTVAMAYIGYDKDCDFWYIQSTDAESGWGPILYDIAMEYASSRSRGLVADRDEVSAEARHVWDYYFESRPDVISTELSDDCMRFPGSDPGPLDHVYAKDPDTLLRLEEAGRLEWPAA